MNHSWSIGESSTSPSSSVHPEVAEDNTHTNEVKVAELKEELIPYLKRFMSKAGFGLTEIEPDHPVFQKYLLLTLYNSSKMLNQLKLRSALPKETSEEDQCMFDRLAYKVNSFQYEPNVVHAMELFIADLPSTLKNIMLEAGFKAPETEINHDAYLSFLSSVVNSLTEIFIQFSRLTPKPQILSCTNSDKEDTPTSAPYSKMKRSSEHISQIEKKPNVKGGFIQDDLPPGFTSIELIATTKMHSIYCISSTSKCLTLKVLESSSPSLKDICNIDAELHFSKIVSHSAFRSSISKTMFQNKLALMLEWANGFPISLINDMEIFDVKEFLVVARDIVSALLAMHMKHIMNLNLTCDHVIYDPQSKSVKIIGLGSCTSFTNKPIFISNHELLNRDLRCISPEQSGRLNREIDFRSDFYSLGIIFYKMLTGRYPFTAENALDLVHLHILQEPTLMCDFNPNIPIPISSFISKLMAKNPENRYQSANAIIHDLDLMNSEYETDNSLSSVTLGQHNLSQTFCIPQKLYGRHNEYNSLCSAFDKLDSSSLELAFVAGKSGSGKTVLISELYKVVAKKGGFFINGKFDQSTQDPYSAILQAIESFCGDLLLKDESTIDKYRSKIISAVGEEGKVLDVISNLNLIIGQQPSISDSFGKDAKNRFNYVFIRFLKAICSAESPIVLVLEDLQWLDNETHNLVSAILADGCIRNLMFIGTYRQNEVTNEHLLTGLLQNIRNISIEMIEIELDNLDHESVNELISDALCVTYLETYALTAWMHEKTDGNPFFVNQVLMSLYQHGLLYLCNDTFKWKWDNSIYDAEDFSKNVLELLRRRILSFDEDTQQALKVASCLGSPFMLSTLQLIVNKKSVIKSVLSTGMITQYERSNSYYRFVHDQIQAAAASLLPKDPSKLLFYIGKKLCVLFTSEELDTNIFTVVGILCYAADIIEDREERINISELCMRAGKKAMAMTAYQQAFDYLKNSMKFLSSDCWVTHYNLSMNIYDLAAKAAYSVANYTYMNELIEEISKNVKLTLHLVQPLCLRIRFYNDTRRYEDAINVAVDILNKIDNNVMTNEFDADIASNVQKVKSLLNEKPSDDILMTRASNQKVISIMNIFSHILSSAYFSNMKLLFFISLQMVQFTFDHGVFSQYSSTGFAALGAVLCVRRDKDGYRFAKFGLTLLGNNPRKETIPPVFNIFYTLVSHFHEPIHDCFNPLLNAYKISLEVGSHEMSILLSTTYFNYSFLSGKSLKHLLNDFLGIKDLLPLKTKTFLAAYQATLHLSGESSKGQIALLSGDYFSYTLCFDANEKGYDISRVSVICAVVAYLFGDYDSALKFIQSCRQHKKHILSLYSYPIYILYVGLISLELAKYMPDKEILLKDAEESIKELKSYVKHAPMNYLNKYRLLQAEMAVVLGDNFQAVAHYQEAIILSQKYCFLHEEAICCERFGLFYLESNSMTNASQMLIKSYTCYEKWGADEKTKNLKKKYSQHCDFKSSNATDFIPSELEVDPSSTDSVSLLTEGTVLPFSGSFNNKRERLS